MHAFLLVGQTNDDNSGEIEKLSADLRAKIMEFPLSKIDDVRQLNALIRLSFSERTLIVAKNIHETGEEAANAFLKNLEEPQENIYFALTAPSERKVLPTIVSRCRIIKIQNSKFQIPNSQEIEDFFAMIPSQKLAFFDKMKGREEALAFIDSLIFFLHKRRDLTNMELLLKTLTRLKANGNVNLHLTNLVINYK